MNILDDLKMQYKLGGIAMKMIYWNIGCFLVSLIFFYQYKEGVFVFPNWIALSSSPIDFVLKPWTFITYAFFHNDFWHLFFNMMVLNFASYLFLTFFSSKQYLGLYILSKRLLSATIGWIVCRVLLKSVEYTPSKLIFEKSIFHCWALSRPFSDKSGFFELSAFSACLMK